MRDSITLTHSAASVVLLTKIALNYRNAIERTIHDTITIQSYSGTEHIV